MGQPLVNSAGINHRLRSLPRLLHVLAIPDYLPLALAQQTTLGTPLSGVAAKSVNGTAISRSGSYVIYTPPSSWGPSNTASDSFSYTISDGHGLTATGQVTVYVSPSGAYTVN